MRRRRIFGNVLTAGRGGVSAATRGLEGLGMKARGCEGIEGRWPSNADRQPRLDLEFRHGSRACSRAGRKKS